MLWKWIVTSCVQYSDQYPDNLSFMACLYLESYGYYSSDSVQEVSTCITWESHVFPFREAFCCHVEFIKVQCFSEYYVLQYIFSFLNLDCSQLYYNVSTIADFKMLIWDLSYCNSMENLDPCICRSTDVCFTSAAPLSEYRNVLQIQSDYFVSTFQILMMYTESEPQKALFNLFCTLQIIVWKDSWVTILWF